MVASAAASGTSGRQYRITRSATQGPRLMLMPKRSRPVKRSSRANAATEGASGIIGAGGEDLPRISWARGTGMVSSGRSEPRSRSPAVASIARYMLPISIVSRIR